MEILASFATAHQTRAKQERDGIDSPMARLAGKVVFITGAAGGIGSAVAQVVTAEGARAALSDINLEAAHETATALCRTGAEAAAFRLDVSRRQEIAEVISAVRDRFGSIDVIVNGAGICPRIPIEEISEADFDRIVSTNLKGTFFVSQIVTPILRAQGSGSIINLSSVGARTGGVAASSVYAATKAGIIALTKSFARSLAPFARVNAIAPGVVDTEMMRIPEEQLRSIVAQVPLGRMASPQEIAQVVVFLASPESSYLTGSTLDVNGGWFMY